MGSYRLREAGNEAITYLCLTEASSGVEDLTDAIILSCVLRVGIISAQLCRLA